MTKAKPKSKTVTDTTEDNPGPGHNSDVAIKLQLYVSRFKAFRKEEGEIYVRRCALVLDAEQDLSPKLFKEFLEQVGLPRNSSEFRKTRTVGKAANRLLAISDRLPDSKNTIRELARLVENNESTFDRLLEDDIITPNVTALQVRTAGLSQGFQEKSERCVAHVDATPLSHSERFALLKQLQDLASTMGATVRMPKSLQSKGGQA